MKIVIAPDSYKESMSAEHVAQHIESGFREVFPSAEYMKVPMADGGEGSLDAIKASVQGQEISLMIKDAYFNDREASYFLEADGKTALIEIAKICGIEHTTPEQRHPEVATTYGVGQVISDAIHRGVNHIVLFIGGSATNDAGAGMVQALGAQLLAKDGQELSVGCAALAAIEHIDLSRFEPAIANIEFEVACDVDNRLLGPQGATYVFGPQKGVKPEQLAHFDLCLERFAKVIQQDLGQDALTISGGGAAGGLGAGLSVFCQAELRNGFDIISELVGLREQVKDADLVITGEGRIDSQSARGKVPCGVGNLAFEYSVPVIGIAGSVSNDVDAVYEQGVSAVFSVLPRPMTLAEAYETCEENLKNTSKNIALVIQSAPLVK
ncbi:glycerate kinase [Vibrio nitrifigilis]|uniref:Glycerate kinase n=1 Tax=Vibrio nitrifigilis TaxID=2789781 RepID=A0ABS0GIN7_9VIBR|nr:glycerate kinase [Vibrio nitrifigilis]MBF9002269.1 glycerate kinase [Vibrio nitrifigilis]